MKFDVTIKEKDKKFYDCANDIISGMEEIEKTLKDKRYSPSQSINLARTLLKGLASIKPNDYKESEDNN